MKLFKIEKLTQGCLQQVDQRVNLTITFLSEIFLYFLLKIMINQSILRKKVTHIKLQKTYRFGVKSILGCLNENLVECSGYLFPMSQAKTCVSI